MTNVTILRVPVSPDMPVTDVVLHEAAEWLPTEYTRDLANILQSMDGKAARDVRLVEDLQMDDDAIMIFACDIERRLNIHLPLPLMCNTLGEVVALCERRRAAEVRS